MTRRQCHSCNLGRIPRTYDQASRIGITLDFINQPLYLISCFSVCPLKRAPLFPIHRPQFSLLIGPLIPDMDVVLLQIVYVGIALQKPEQFINNGSCMQLLCGHKWEACTQIEAHRMAENAQGSGSCAVLFSGSFCANTST